jgi:hypothetical protein
LLGGLLEWLTGTMGPMGITIPEDIFSLSGIFSLVMQVLGVGWDMLRMKAVKSMGEPTVNALETGADAGFSIFKTMRSGGIMGLWEFAKEKFSDLKETIIDAIKDVCASGANVDHQSDRSGNQMAPFIAHSGCWFHQSHYGYQRYRGILC